MFLSYKEAFCSYCASLLTFLILFFIPTVLELSGVAVLTVGMLTCNLWSVLPAILTISDFHYNIASLVAAFIITIFGPTAFALTGSPYRSELKSEAEQELSENYSPSVEGEENNSAA